MFAPVMDLRGLIAIGPRVAEHTVNSIPMYPFPSYEDVRLKNPSRRRTSRGCRTGREGYHGAWRKATGPSRFSTRRC